MCSRALGSAGKLCGIDSKHHIWQDEIVLYWPLLSNWILFYNAFASWLSEGFPWFDLIRTLGRRDQKPYSKYQGTKRRRDWCKLHNMTYVTTFIEWYSKLRSFLWHDIEWFDFFLWCFLCILSFSRITGFWMSRAYFKVTNHHILIKNP